MRSKSTRREFLRGAALGGAGVLILKDSRLAFGSAANSRPNIAIIGCGGRGTAFTHGYAYAGGALYNIVAMCDVNEARAAEAYKAHPDVPKFEDYRILLDKMHNQLDGVMVITSDHNHAPIAAAVMRAGKPVYCEKPLTRTVDEARRLRQLAVETKVVTQMGNQGGYDVKAVEVLWSGAIGEVREVHNWLAGTLPGPRSLPTGPDPVPATLKWDLWLGPAAARPYHPGWMSWLFWRDFGTSLLGNRGAHSMATVFKSLKIGELWKAPIDAANPPLIRVTGECPETPKECFPKWEKVRWDVPAREGMPPVAVHWYCGDLEGHAQMKSRAVSEEALGRKLDWGDAGENKWTDWLGSVTVGSKGKIVEGGMGEMRELLPKEQWAGYAGPPQVLPRPLGGKAHDGWISAIKGGPAPMSSFDGFSGPYTEFMMLAHVATLFPGEELKFDPIACKIVNNAKADEALRPPHREGWPV